MKLSYLVLSVCLLFPQIALGQICGVSSPLGDVSGLNWSLMQGRDLKSSDKDYPFLDQEARRNRYAQFWVNADVYPQIGSVAELRVSDCNKNVRFTLWEAMRLTQISMRPKPIMLAFLSRVISGIKRLY